jgi:5-formyltetrahydrofolate cyclo-ligase
MRAKRLSIYLSMPSGEIQTTSIVRHALQNGKAVFVPYLYPSENQDGNTPKKVMDMVRLKDLEDYEGLKRDSWGIPTISKESVAQRERILDDAGRGEVGLDLILLPGLAFEVLGAGNGVKRLGHGRGFYDYFLHRYRDTYEKEVVGNTLLLYGLTLEEQIMGGPGGNDVPVGELDVLIDGLVVGDGRIIDTRG